MAGDEAIGSAGLVVALAVAVFAAPLTLGSSTRRVVSPGGLIRLRRRRGGMSGWLWCTAGIWAFADFLDLPYTITFVVYDVLPPVFPGIVLDLLGCSSSSSRSRSSSSSLRLCVSALVSLLVVGLAQLVLLLVLGGVTLANVPARFAAEPEADPTARALVAGTAPCCSSVRACRSTSVPRCAAAAGRSGAVSSSRSRSWASASSWRQSGCPPSHGCCWSSPCRAAAIAKYYSGRSLEVAVALGIAVGTLALIVAEYLALGRLLHWLHGPPLRRVLLWIAVPFTAADVISLINPEQFYDKLLKPSLGALFISFLIVFLVFPLFQRGLRWLPLS